MPPGRPANGTTDQRFSCHAHLVIGTRPPALKRSPEARFDAGRAEGHGYHEVVNRQESYDPSDPYAPPSPADDFDLRPYQPIQPERRWRDLARKLWAPLAGLGLLVWKLKAVFVVALKFKVFTTSASMLVSIGAYALIWGWKFAVGLVLLLLVHELGHVFELRRQGVPASAPLFIPFLGAVVGMKQMPKDAWREARVALAGPILGSIGAGAVWVAAEALDSEFLLALAFVGFFLNLFNLLPIVPLDGGRAMAAVHPLFWAVGLVGLVGLVVVAPNPILILILVFGALELWRRWRGRNEPGAREYYRVAPWQRATAGVTYLALAAVLALAMSETFVERSF
jgi:Zn-dependent protease